MITFHTDRDGPRRLRQSAVLSQKLRRFVAGTWRVTWV
jgi:hypothetical protein